MRNAWAKYSVLAGAVVVPLCGVPTVAASQTPDSPPSMTGAAAQELTQRSKKPTAGAGKQMSERGVRNMVYYAFALVPEEVAGPDGNPVPVDKSDPSKFVIPEADARGVIRAATRSAYADACGLPELAQANYEAMLAEQKATRTWTREQILMIEALHLFSVSFFTGRASFGSEPDSGSAEGGSGPQNGAAGSQQVQPPKCPPEQKQKVESAIKAYVASARAQ